MNLPKIVVQTEEELDNVPAIPNAIPSLIAASITSTAVNFTNESKRSILKSNLRAYEADPVKLTPGLDPTQLTTNTSSITEPIFDQAPPRVRFASTDHIFHASESDQIIRRGIDQLHFVLPLNSPLMRPTPIETPANSAAVTNEPLKTSLNRFQTPPLTAQSAGAPIMNSPYSRMCDQLEHFVDAEIEFTDNLLINRPLNERNASVDLSPELEKASISSSNLHQNATSSPPITTPNPPTTESRSLWLGNVDPTVTEEEIRKAFEGFGMIENIRLLPAKECAFVNYFEMESAIRGRNSMQGKALGNMILRIGFGKIADNPRDTNANNNNNNNNNLLSTNNANTNANSNNNRSVWIGNLSPEITSDLLMHHFNVFGPIESCRVLEAKSCAFVNFYTAEAAATAKFKMNGALIGNCVIKTGNTNNNNAGGAVSKIGINNESIINIMKNNAAATKPVQATTFASIMCEFNEAEDLESDDSNDGTQLREYRRQVEAAPEEIPEILKKLMKKGDLHELAIDSYGNILLQKIIERAQMQEQLLIMKSLQGHMVNIAMQKNGTWVIQKLVTCATDSRVQLKTIDELKEQTVELLEDQFGNYVIQCILAVGLPADDERLKVITEKIVQNSRKLAIGKFSSRALKSILESSTNQERQKLIAQSLAKESVLLSVDPNGAVVIQWILDSDLPGKVALITGQLQGRLAQIALTKQGGVIVARIIGSVEEPNYRDSAILELYELTNEPTTTPSNSSAFKSSSHNYLDSLLNEPSTCSILFKAFQLSKPAIRLRLAEKLKPKLMKILKELTGEKEEKVIEGFGEREMDERIPVHLVKLYQELIRK